MEDKIIALIRQRLEEDVEINENSDFFNDLGLSSLDMATLVFSMEDEIGVKINVMDLIGIKTVGELIQRINKEYIK